jgi:hypothetical protein
MPISTVNLTDTFDSWRIRTNQVITSLNTINEANAALTGSITITNPSRFNSNVSLNVSSGMIKGDGGLISNIQTSVTSIAAFNKANAANVLAYNTSLSVGTIYDMANAAYDAANATVSVYINTSPPVSPVPGDFWWDNQIGRLLIYYNDGDTSQWVDASPANIPIIIFNTANTANAGFAVTNTAFGVANAGYTVANAGFAVTNTTFGVTNTAFGVANASFGRANGGYTVANAAFDKANTGIKIGNETTSSSSYYVTFANTSSGDLTTINVSSSALTFVPSTGTLSATIFNSLSDATLKENVEPISNALDVINKLSGVGFDWKESGQHSYGVVAQNMEKVIPDLVGNINNMKTVNYDGIIAFLIEAIKELNNKLENKE